MKEQKLIYTYHNPNGLKDTAAAITKIFANVNIHKIESALQRHSNTYQTDK